MRISFGGRVYEHLLIPVLPVLVVLLVLIGLAPAPLWAAVSAEVAVAQPGQRAVAGRWPAAAFDGTRYLVVWEDLRAGRPILYGARVGTDADALDPLGFPLLDAFLDETVCCEYEPVVAAGDGGFLVVTEVAGQILGVRVSGDGKVLDPDGIVIATAVSQASRPALVFDGEQYMVAWAQGAGKDSPDSAVYWARVRTDGTVLDPGGVRGDALVHPATPVALSFDGTNHLLTWMDWAVEPESQALYGARIARDGTRVDAAAIRIGPIAVSIDLAGPVASFDGTNHVIAWKGVLDEDSYYASWMLSARVTPERTVLDPDALGHLWVETGLLPLHRLGIVAANGRSVITWSRNAIDESWYYNSVSMIVVEADGVVNWHPASEYANGLQATHVAHADGGLLLWLDPTDISTVPPLIRGLRLDPTGQPTAGSLALGLTASAQRVRAVASDGQTFFVVWEDTRITDPQGLGLFGARIAADGTPLDPDGILLTTEAAEQISVVFDGASFVVTWSSSSAGGGGGLVKAMRVSPDGDLLDNQPLVPVDWSVTGVAAASDGTHTLLVGPFYTDQKLAAVLLDQEGAVASAVVRPGTDRPGSLPLGAVVSFDGAGYLVVWHDDTAILGQRVGIDGALAGPSFTIAGELRTSYCPRVAFGGDNHLVVWQDGDGNVLARRVSPSGEVLGSGRFLITTRAEESRSPTPCPAVTFDGEHFVVAWREPSAGDQGLLDLRAAAVTVDGNVLNRFAISEQPESEGFPFLAAGEGQVLAAYNRFVAGAPYETHRAQVRFIVPEIETRVEGGGCQAGAPAPAPVALLWLLGSLAVLRLARRRSAR